MIEAEYGGGRWKAAVPPSLRQQTRLSSIRPSRLCLSPECTSSCCISRVVLRVVAVFMCGTCPAPAARAYARVNGRARVGYELLLLSVAAVDV